MSARGLYRGWYQTAPDAPITYYWVIAYSARQAVYLSQRHLREVVGRVYDSEQIEPAGLCYRWDLPCGIYGEDGLRP